MILSESITFEKFAEIVERHPDGVVLLEGRRTIPASDYDTATALARDLALRFPNLRFRSGNAEGSDQAFSEGVAQVDASRLQVVAPYASHRKNRAIQTLSMILPNPYPWLRRMLWFTRPSMRRQRIRH